MNVIGENNNIISDILTDNIAFMCNVIVYEYLTYFYFSGESVSIIKKLLV